MKNLGFMGRVVAVAFCLLIAGASGAFSQSNAWVPIDYTHKLWDFPKGGTGGHGSKRSPSSAQYIPSTFYDAENGSLVFEGTVSLEGIPCRVEDEEGDILLSGLLTLGKGEEKTVSVCGLPSGTYYIILCMGDEEYAGEFTK